jgi:transposase
VQALDVGRATVERTRKRFVLEGFEIALNGRPRQRTYERKLDGKAEAHLIALACSEPPEGHACWTLRLLAERVVQLEQVEVDTVSYETVRRVLKKVHSSLGSRNSG